MPNGRNVPGPRIPRAFRFAGQYKQKTRAKRTPTPTRVSKPPITRSKSGAVMITPAYSAWLKSQNTRMVTPTRTPTPRAGIKLPKIGGALGSILGRTAFGSVGSKVLRDVWKVSGRKVKW